jgi:hypothetical protein
VLFSTDSYERQGVPFSLGEGYYEVEVVIDSRTEPIPPEVLTLTVHAESVWDKLNVWEQGSSEPPNQAYEGSGHSL